MGLIISRFKKKKSTIEVLDDIDKQITKLEQFRRQNQERQKKFIGCLILYSILLYIGVTVIFYFYYLPPTWLKRLKYSSPLLIFPILIWLLKKFLHWYFVKRISKNDLALNELQDKKKKILEDVMEEETYKKAREILEKYDPGRFKQLETPDSTPARTATVGSTVRQRNVPVSGKQMAQVRPTTPHATRLPYQKADTPAASPKLPPSFGIRPRALLSPQMNGNYDQVRGPPLPRPILPRERSKVDRVLEYLVGDGPQNRYALICKYCHSHNGMALKEEFEYISFRCCYCYQMNMAKKQRPFAPKLEVPPVTTNVGREPVLIETNAESTDDDEDDSDQSDEDKNGSAVPDNSRNSGMSDKGGQFKTTETREAESTEKVRQSNLECSQLNDVNTDEKTEKATRPS